jgi:thymidylate synthase
MSYIPTIDESYTYDALLRDVLEFGEVREDRTGVGTQSVFAPEDVCYNLTHAFPLLTRRKIFFRGAVEELLFFLRGERDTYRLEKLGVNIWHGNTTREFLDSRGLYHLDVGDMGAGYGWQWRRFNQPLKRENAMFGPPAIDQIANVIESIKEDPYSRRHIVTAWNPAQLDEMALPPCHIMFQFYVSTTGTLSCKMYQRSVDIGCGLPFNIASYALLTMIISKVCGLTPGDLTITMGDAHVYNNHVDTLADMLETRKPQEFPSLKINRDLKSIRDIEALCYEDFILENYNPLPTIKLEMAV